MMPPRSRTRFVAAMGIASLVNVLILADTPPTSFPFRPHADASLSHLVETEQRSLAEGFSLYLDLHEVAAGRTLVVDPEMVDPVLVDGLADMSLIVDPLDLEVDPVAMRSLEGSRGATRLFDEGPLLEYLVVVPDTAEVRIRLFQAGGMVFAVGERRLTELTEP